VAYPEPLERLVVALERLPGVGRRTAERLAFHLLRDRESRALSAAIVHAVEHTLRCGRCSNVADADPCSICANPERDQASVLVVEAPRDVEAVERAGCYRGLYHVLMGALNPVDGTDLEHLAIPSLVERVRREEGLREVVIGTDPDAEGEATGLALLEALDRAGASVRVTRLARGLPAGSALEYLHRGVLEDALEGRVVLRAGKA